MLLVGDGHMGVSINRGTLESSIVFSIIDHPLGGTPILGKPHTATVDSMYSQSQ